MAFPISGHTSGVKSQQSPYGDHEISKGKQREDLSGILGHSPIAFLLVAKQYLPRNVDIFGMGYLFCLVSRKFPYLGERIPKSPQPPFQR